jgi:lauroyl/myristoyl acyltransferase/ADP-heptose:LPS heptosyltransferase
MSNLHHAFPNKDLLWHKKICTENFYRLIELGLLNLAGAFFSDERIKSNFKLHRKYREIVDKIAASEKGAIVLVPHFTTMEAMTFFPTIVDNQDLPDIGVVYRPFAEAYLEKFIKKTRERFGIRLISRKNGFFEAMKILRSGGVVSLFFDQNAGESGYRTLFFNRVVFSTDLPNLLYAKFKVPVYFLYPRRLGVWRTSIVLKRLKFDENNPKTIIFAANKYLENILKGSDWACADWLWAHDRWKASTVDVSKLGKTKRNWTKESKAYLFSRDRIKNFRMLVRMPNWLGDVVMAIPVLRMLRASRDDMDLTLLCQQQFVDFLKALKIADNVIPLPEKKMSYFFNLSAVKNSYYDVHVSLVNSLRGDLETFTVNCPRKIGIDTKNRSYRKFFIGDLYTNYFDVGSVHQTKLWQNMIEKFGFSADENFSTFRFCVDARKPLTYKYSIGIICGSANNPYKRWPTELWKALLWRIFDRYHSVHVNLYGAKADVVFTNELAAFFSRTAISNLAGRTTILELVEYMQKDDLVIAIDTGGMHVANMFGRPLVCLYGATNYVATGPVFDGQTLIIRPDGCPLKGGFPTEDIRIEPVFKAVQAILG